MKATILLQEAGVAAMALESAVQAEEKRSWSSTSSHHSIKLEAGVG